MTAGGPLVNWESEKTHQKRPCRRQGRINLPQSDSFRKLIDVNAMRF